jgi:hypothetical protein
VSGPLALVVLLPLRAGRGEALLGALASTPADAFAPVATTHFARWVHIPALLGPDGTPVAPPQQYLLFTAELDGALDDWAQDVCSTIGPTVDRIFEHCDGYPGSTDRAAFTAFLEHHRVAAGFSIVAYSATVAEVRDSLELQRQLREFAIESQLSGPAELRARWLERFAS